MATATKIKKSTKSTATEKGSADAFAVIFTGGKQYVVHVGDSVKIEAMPGDLKEGDKVTFENVLLSDDGTESIIGAPYIKGSKVMGTLTKIGRHDKVLVVKFKQKSRYYKKNGHRQPYFQILIDSIA